MNDQPTAAAAGAESIARRLLDLVLRCALGGLLIYAGVQKLRDLEQFFLDVQHFDLTPWNLSMAIAMYLPWLEVIVGVALIARRLYLGALTLNAAMTVVFLGAIGSAWWRGLDITCGCFGHENNQTNFPQHLALNGAMLAATVILAGLHRPNPAQRT